jgi:hypothetical protein
MYSLHHLKHLHSTQHQKQIHVSQHILLSQPAESGELDFGRNKVTQSIHHI